MSIQPTMNEVANENKWIHNATCKAFGFSLIALGTSGGHASALDTIRETVESVLY